MFVADKEETSIVGTINRLQGWVECFEHAKLAGVVKGVNATDVGDIHNNPVILNHAYEMGWRV